MRPPRTQVLRLAIPALDHVCFTRHTARALPDYRNQLRICSLYMPFSMQIVWQWAEGQSLGRSFAGRSGINLPSNRVNAHELRAGKPSLSSTPIALSAVMRTVHCLPRLLRLHGYHCVLLRWLCLQHLGASLHRHDAHVDEAKGFHTPAACLPGAASARDREYP